MLIPLSLRHRPRSNVLLAWESSLDRVVGWENLAEFRVIMLKFAVLCFCAASTSAQTYSDTCVDNAAPKIHFKLDKKERDSSIINYVRMLKR
jgi:hypothetical protein